MSGADVDEDFIHELNNEEIEHFRSSLYNAIRMVRRETDRREEMVLNG
jgi:hypothetical protein